MNYAQIRKYDTSNGPGVCATLFVSGCTHNCKDCFNQEQQNFAYGDVFTGDTEEEFVSMCKNENIKGVNILGGEPMQQTQDNTLVELLQRLRKEVKKPIWLWSGYLFEEIISDSKRLEILKNVDVLIDGKFEAEKKDLMLKYKGSSNQRVISVAKSLEKKEIVLLEI